MDKFEKAAELLKDDDFMSKLDTLDGVDELCNAFRENGADLTPEETKMLVGELLSTVGTKELSADQLENVSGGVNVLSGIQTCVKGLTTGWKWGQQFCDWMYKTFGVV